jgi:hypothetical protein
MLTSMFDKILMDYSTILIMIIFSILYLQHDSMELGKLDVSLL